MRSLMNRFNEENAGAMVEYVIILPIVFVVILSMIVTAFIIYDRSMIESAAKRGAIYASHCVCDPNYGSVAAHTGDLDIAVDQSFDFTGVGKNIKAYRYIIGGVNVTSQTRDEVKRIIDKTRIAWTDIGTVSISCEQKNHFIYQDVTVSVSTSYSIPQIFGVFGLETRYEYSASANVRITDPDEFIRNADLVVDMIVQVDNATGGHLKSVTDKIGQLAKKIVEWIDVDK